MGTHRLATNFWATLRHVTGSSGKHDPPKVAELPQLAANSVHSEHVELVELERSSGVR